MTPRGVLAVAKQQGLVAAEVGGVEAAVRIRAGHGDMSGTSAGAGLAGCTPHANSKQPRSVSSVSVSPLSMASWKRCACFQRLLAHLGSGVGSALDRQLERAGWQFWCGGRLSQSWGGGGGAADADVDEAPVALRTLSSGCAVELDVQLLEGTLRMLGLRIDPIVSLWATREALRHLWVAPFGRGRDGRDDRRLELLGRRCGC